MKAALYLQYRQATITVDLTQHIDAVVEILGGTVFDVGDKRLHRFYYTTVPMRDILNRLRTNMDICNMLNVIEQSMKKLDIDFNMDNQISTVNPSVLTIDTRS